jgi:hypothetical protein
LSTGEVGWMSEAFAQQRIYYLDLVLDTVTLGENCPGQLPHVFRPGDRATVTQAAFSLTFQAEPNTTSQQIGDGFVPGEFFTVGVGDAMCDLDDLATWVPVVIDNGATGWVMETRQRSHIDPTLDDVYFIEQASFGQSGRLICPDGKLSRLEVGDLAILERGVRFRQAGPSGKVIHEIPRGTIVTVIGGPRCGGGHTWWEIRLPDQRIGWSSEGWVDESFYYMAPVR